MSEKWAKLSVDERSELLAGAGVESSYELMRFSYCKDFTKLPVKLQISIEMKGGYKA